MTNWNEIKQGDVVKCGDDTLEVIEWRGEKYLAGEHDMWAVSEFDPKDWEIVKGE